MLFRGSHYEDAREILFYSPGITVTSFKVIDPTLIRAHVQVDKQARMGEYHARVVGDSGVSPIQTFYITPFPIVRTVQGAHVDRRIHRDCDFDHPDVVKNLNVTMAGFVLADEPHYFAVDMKKGQRLTAEVHGMRLGAKFDTYLAIVDQRHFELAVSDDTTLAMQDSIASTIIPADGRYIIVLRESSYAQGSFYLLHIGTFPRPNVVFPLGGRPGESLHVKYIGDVSGPIDATIDLPSTPVEHLDVIPEQDGISAPSPNHLRVSDMPAVMEQEPNDTIESSNAYDGELPVAFNGIIEKPQDIDYYRFRAHKGQQLDIRVYARDLRSPLDSVLSLYDPHGKQITSNDDSGGPDSYIHFAVPSDGTYAISVTDQLHQGGAEFVYRIEITIASAEVDLTIPPVSLFSQHRLSVVVPRGNRYATLMRAIRKNVTGEVGLSFQALPASISAQTVDATESEFPVVFQAESSAHLCSTLCDVTAQVRDADSATKVASSYRQNLTLVIGPNQTTMYGTHLDRLAVAVTKEAPFMLNLEQPKVPLVQGGAMDLKVSAVRQPGFNGSITVKLLFSPPGVTGQPTVDLPSGQSSVGYPINAQSNAPLRTWKVCVIGSSEVNGEVVVSSQLVDLTVAEPYVTASTRMTAIQQGTSGTVTFKLEQKTPFEGKVRARLGGLPANVTAGDSEFSVTDTRVSFPVTVGEKAALGAHPGLFCSAVIMKDGEPIVHNLGRGGVLRVDPPAPTKAAGKNVRAKSKSVSSQAGATATSK